MEGNKLGHWKNAPLAYVVADVAISPYMTIAKRVPEFQDRLRATFPQTVESVVLRLDAPQAQGAIAPALTPEQNWQFISTPPKMGVSLSSRSISFHATTYTNYQDFESKLKVVLTAFGDTVPNAFVNRIGLRYIDLIVPSRGKSVRAYLDQGLHGFKPPGAISESQTVVATSHRFDQGAMNISLYVKLPSGSNFPSNISVLPLAPANIVVRSDPKTRIELGCIDLDRYVEPNASFEWNGILRTFSIMHRDQSNAFKAMLSNLATKEWQ